MARIVARKPIIGFVSGLIFGALGILLLGVERSPAGASRLSSILFSLAGYFFLFVALMAVLAAVLSVLRVYRRR